MWITTLRRTFEYATRTERSSPMHGSLHLIMATESHRARHAAARDARLAASLPSRFATILARVSPRAVAAAHGIPPRAAPGTDSPSLGHPTAAHVRGR
jgi:hypothetical protein